MANKSVHAALNRCESSLPFDSSEDDIQSHSAATVVRWSSFLHSEFNISLGTSHRFGALPQGFVAQVILAETPHDAAFSH